MGGLCLGSWPLTHWHGNISDFAILNFVKFISIAGLKSYVLGRSGGAASAQEKEHLL